MGGMGYHVTLINPERYLKEICNMRIGFFIQGKHMMWECILESFKYVHCHVTCYIIESKKVKINIYILGAVSIESKPLCSLNR